MCPSNIQQLSHLWHTPARRVHWVVVQEISTHDQLYLVRFDARSRSVFLGLALCQSWIFVPQGSSNVRKEMHGALPIRDLNRCHNLWICLRTSTLMLQTIRSLSLLTSKLRRWSARMSLLRSSSSQPHLSSIPFCPYSCGFLLHPLVAQSVVQSRCYPRPRTSLLGSSVGNGADIFETSSRFGIFWCRLHGFC